MYVHRKAIAGQICRDTQFLIVRVLRIRMRTLEFESGPVSMQQI